MLKMFLLVTQIFEYLGFNLSILLPNVWRIPAADDLTICSCWQTLIWQRWMVKMACDRELWAFICVLAVVRDRAPNFRHCSSCRHTGRVAFDSKWRGKKERTTTEEEDGEDNNLPLFFLKGLHLVELLMCSWNHAQDEFQSAGRFPLFKCVLPVFLGYCQIISFFIWCCFLWKIPFCLHLLAWKKLSHLFVFNRSSLLMFFTWSAALRELDLLFFSHRWCESLSIFWSSSS